MPFLSTFGGGSQKGFYADTNVGFGKGSATNATTTEYTLNGVTYRSHAFLTTGSSGTFTWEGAGNAGQVLTSGGSGSNMTWTYPVPSGGIIIWSGAANAIPSGWVLCDGTNNTPDLRQRFVMGSGDNPDVARTGQNVGAQGGYTDTIVVQHNHTITDNGHTHNLLYNHGAFGGSSGATTPRSGNTPVTPGITGRISTNSTGISINNEGSAGTDRNIPPFYALCYIMKT